jgi:hypothetical protein
MDLHDNQPGAHLRAGVPPDLSHMSTPAFGSLGTAAASRVRATASPGVPVVLMSTPAASMQHPGEGGAALLRPPDSHTTQAAAGASATDGANMAQTSAMQAQTIPAGNQTNLFPDHVDRSAIDNGADHANLSNDHSGAARDDADEPPDDHRDDADTFGMLKLSAESISTRLYRIFEHDADLIKDVLTGATSPRAAAAFLYARDRDVIDRLLPELPPPEVLLHFHGKVLDALSAEMLQSPSYSRLHLGPTADAHPRTPPDSLADAARRTESLMAAPAGSGVLLPGPTADALGPIQAASAVRSPAPAAPRADVFPSPMAPAAALSAAGIPGGRPAAPAALVPVPANAQAPRSAQAGPYSTRPRGRAPRSTRLRAPPLQVSLWPIV